MIRGLRVPVHLTSREALRMFHVADIWAARSGNRVRLVSANDHVHNRRSAHYHGLALDFHSSDPDGLAALFRRMGYRVLWKVRGHHGHVHVEHDVEGSAPPSWPGFDMPGFRQASRGTRTGGADLGHDQARALTLPTKPPA